MIFSHCISSSTRIYSSILLCSLHCPRYTIPISVFIIFYLVVVVEIWHVRCTEHMLLACVYVYHVDYDAYEECMSSVYSV